MFKMSIVIDNDVVGENLIEYCISVILKEAKQESRLVRQLMYVMLSAYTNNPLNLGINSPSGEGKNWVLEKVSEKFPKEDVQSLSGMTEKALFHKKGVLVIRNEQGEYEEVNSLIKEIDSQIEDKESEMARTKDSNLVKGLKSMIKEFQDEKKEIYRNAMKLIDLEHKILVFLDTPPMNLLSALMSLLAHDKYEAEYEYADTNNGIITRTNILRGWPVVIYAQAIDYSKHERWAEAQRRFIITNPEMDSKEKYSQAVDLAIDKFGLPDKIYQKVVSSDQEKDSVREAIKSLKESVLNISSSLAAGKNPTFVPFHETVKSGLPKDKSQEMNSGKRFGVILSLLALINIDRRPRIKIVTKGNPIIDVIPLALFEDLKESIYLMQYANGVRPYVLEWYYKALEPTYYAKTQVDSKVKVFNKGNQVVYEDRIAVTTKELVQITKEVYHKTYTSSHLLQTFIYPLMNQGYIDSQPSELDHRSHIYFPTVIVDKNVYFNGSVRHNNFLEAGKLQIRDFTTFPSKSYLTSRIQWLLRYYYDDGVLAKVYNHENQEITIENLIDRYYQRPEDYFTDKNPTDAPESDTSDKDSPDSTDFGSQPDEGSNNNISETPKTGSSYNETDQNMQELEGSESEDCKKLLCQADPLKTTFSNPGIDGSKQPLWPVGTPEQSKAFNDEVERLQKEKTKEEV